MKIVAYAPDLMDRSRFGVLSGEAEVSFVSHPGQLAGGDADVIVADLSRPGVVGEMERIEHGRKLGFISHVDAEGRMVAQAAGVEVFARSRFFSRLVAIVTQGEEGHADTGESSESP